MNFGSFSVPIPSGERDPAAIADFIELNAIGSSDNTISVRDLSTQLIKGEDEEDDRVADEDVPDYLNAAFSELAERLEHTSSGSHYPFSLNNSGDLVTYQPGSDSWLYIYCLVATRANMATFKKQLHEGREIDGSLILELVTPFVLERYLKIALDNSIVVGTGRLVKDKGGLEKAVATFLERYQEHGNYENFFDHGTAGDGGCDVIGWHTLEDRRPGKATVFCSCKTGYSWKSTLDYIPNPRRWSEAFVQARAFTVMPIPCLVVTESLSRKAYRQKVEEHHLLAFDRIRICRVAPDVSDGALIAECRAWTSAAAKAAFGIALEGG